MNKLLSIQNLEKIAIGQTVWPTRNVNNTYTRYRWTTYVFSPAAFSE